MNGLSPDARSLLRRVKPAHEPSPAERERVRVALAVRLAAGTALSASTAAAGGSSAAASLNALSVGKALLSGLLLSSLGMGALTLARGGFEERRPAAVTAGERSANKAAEPPSVAARAPEASANTVEVDERPAAPELYNRAVRRVESPVTRTPAPVAVEPGAPSAEPPSVVASSSAAEPPSVAAFSAPAVASPSSAGVNPPRVPDAPALAAEARALADAQRALDQGSPGTALELLGEHERRFRGGLLGEERAAARVFALCAMGRHADAARERASFLAAAPQSPLAARVKAACVTNERSR